MMRVLGIKPSYARLMLKLMVTDCIRWSRHIYVEHVTGCILEEPKRRQLKSAGHPPAGHPPAGHPTAAITEEVEVHTTRLPTDNNKQSYKSPHSTSHAATTQSTPSLLSTTSYKEDLLPPGTSHKQPLSTPTSPPPLTAPEPPDIADSGNKKVKIAQQLQPAPPPSEAPSNDDDTTTTGTQTSTELIIENHHQLDGPSALPSPPTSSKLSPSTHPPDSQPAARDRQPEENQDVVTSHLDTTVNYSIDDICDLTIADTSHDDDCI